MTDVGGLEKVRLSTEIKSVRSALEDPDYEFDESQIAPETLELWNQHKKERNAIGAIMIANTFSQMEEHMPDRPPYGLLTSKYTPLSIMPEFGPKPELRGRVEAIDTIFRGIGTTFRVELADYLGDVSQRFASDPDRRAYERLSVLTKIVWQGDTPPPSDARSGPEFFLSRGVGTAVKGMRACMNTIPIKYLEKYGKIPDSRTHATIARNSYNLIVKFASGHIASRIPGLSGIVYNTWLDGFTHNFEDTATKVSIFDPETVELVESGKREELRLTEDTLWGMEMDEALSIAQNSSITASVVTGCLALAPTPIATGGTATHEHPSVVKGIWDNACDIIEKI